MAAVCVRLTDGRISADLQQLLGPLQQGHPQMHGLALLLARQCQDHTALDGDADCDGVSCEWLRR